MSRFLKTLIAACLVATPVAAEKLGLGRKAMPDEVSAWDIDVRPDGVGLPVGSGSVADGEVLFTEKCAACHGDFGEAVGRWPVLAGGSGTLTNARPVKTVGSYWPYLSTAWDYIHRAMPFGAGRSLQDDEVYALMAYILYLNDTVEDENFVLSNENFLTIELENEDGFYLDDRPTTEYPLFSQEACMSDCKLAVEITMRAAVVDVTPEETAAKAVAQQAKMADTAAQQTKSEAAALNAELVSAGEKVFKKCKACHKVGETAKNATGPVLNGVFGRTAGVFDGFKYSSDMSAAGADGLVWDEATLTEFLTKPKSLIKKTKMSFPGLKKEADLQAVIEYLKSVSQ